MPEIVVNLNLDQHEALQFAKDLARDDAFRERLATDPLGTLESRKISVRAEQEINFSFLLPPKHAVEGALVNIEEASEFAPGGSSSRNDPFGFWAFVIFIAT